MWWSRESVIIGTLKRFTFPYKLKSCNSYFSHLTNNDLNYKSVCKHNNVMDIQLPKKILSMHHTTTQASKIYCLQRGRSNEQSTFSQKKRNTQSNADLLCEQKLPDR